MPQCPIAGDATAFSTRRQTALLLTAVVFQSVCLSVTRELRLQTVQDMERHFASHDISMFLNI